MFTAKSEVSCINFTKEICNLTDPWKLFIASLPLPHTYTLSLSLSLCLYFAVTILRSSFEVPLKMERIGCPETSVTTNLLCVTFQKSGDLISYLVCYCW